MLPPQDLNPEEKFGRYLICQKLGQGGMGTVYKAFDTHLDRFVALKVLNSDSLNQEHHYKRFLREAKATAKLRHPHIVHIFDIGREKDQVFFTMDFVEGNSLKEFSRNHSLGFKQIARIVETVAQAVFYAHKEGVIHRDLKPDNIMINKEGEVKVMDFGLAKIRGSQEKLSQSGMILGTLQYMPLEQAAGSRQVDERSDVYALGAILYELMTKRPPFLGSSSFELLYKIQNEEPPLPSQVQARIPRNLEKICWKALRKKKSQRYQNALEMMEDLERFRNGQAVRAPAIQASFFLYKVLVVFFLVGLSLFFLVLSGKISKTNKTSKTNPELPFDLFSESINKQTLDLWGCLVDQNHKERKEFHLREIVLLEIDWRGETNSSEEPIIQVKGTNLSSYERKISIEKKKLHLPLTWITQKAGLFDLTVELHLREKKVRQKLSVRVVDRGLNQKGLLWKFKAQGAIQSGYIVSEDLVYFGSDDNYFYALNRETGHLVWKFRSQGAIRSSPNLNKSTIYLGSHDGSLYALDKNKGTKKWSYLTMGKVDSYPWLEDSSIYFSSHNDSFYALDIYDGKQQWKAKFQALRGANRPILEGDFIYFGATRIFYCLNKKTGAILSKRKVGKIIRSAPILTDDFIYFGCHDGYVYALKREPYKHIWKTACFEKNEMGEQKGVFTPALIDNVLYCGSLSGSIYLLDRFTGKVLAKIPAKDSIYTSLVQEKELLYFTCANKTLYAFNTGTRKIEWEFSLEGNTTKKPLVIDKTIYCGTQEGYFYAIERN